MRFPGDPLRTSTLITESAALAATVFLAVAGRAELALSPWYPLKAGGLFVVVVLMVLGYVGQSHPFAQFGPANQLTTLRAVLAVLVTSLIGEPRTPSVALTAAAVGLAATLLDGVDGWLARRAGTSSAFGARFDVEVDALLIQALVILAWLHGKAGAWVLLSGLMRYGFVASGWLWPWMHGPLTPTLRARVICIVQIAALLLAIAPFVAPAVSEVVAAVGLAALSYSFLIDTLRLRRAAI